MNLSRLLVLLAVPLAAVTACDRHAPTAVGGVGADTLWPAAGVAPSTMDTTVGSSVQFRVLSPAGHSWTWISSDTMVAWVHPDSGRVVVRRPGTSTIVARSRSQPRIEGAALLRARIADLGPVPAGAFTTDATGYIAYRLPGALPRYQFRIISRYENREATTLYLGRCLPDSPHPLFTVVSGGQSGYAQPWACVGHDQQFAVRPGDVRIDTLVVQGPNAFQGGTPIGSTEGDFSLYYDVRLAPGDGAPPAPASVMLSNAFRIRTSESPPP